MVTIANEYISVSTRGDTDIINITDAIEQKLSRSGLQKGVVVVSSAGSTASITTCEYEPGLVEDLKRAYEKLIPQDKNYSHNNAWHDGNAHAHLRASITGPSVAVSFSDGSLCLGTWQQVILIDFDNRPRQRKILLQFIGE